MFHVEITLDKLNLGVLRFIDEALKAWEDSMNIVYLIGNGFDLNFGLKTRSSDFMEYISSHYQEHEYINYVDNLKKILDSKESYGYDWSDFEKTLGEFSNEYNSYILKDDINGYFNCINGLNVIFHNFIIETNTYAESINLDEKKVKRLISFLCNACSDGVHKIEKEIFMEHYTEEQEYHISIINYNYTTVLDRALQLYFTNLDKGQSCINIDDRTIYLDNYLHIHGCVSNDDGHIFGVDNVTQISNKSFHKQDIILNCLVKPLINGGLKNYKLSTSANIINSADIICIYGMSCGATDKTWWKIIKEKLISDKKSLLVYASNTKIPGDIKGRSYLPKIIIDTEKEKLYRNAEFSISEKVRADNFVVSFKTKTFDLV